MDAGSADMFAAVARAAPPVSSDSPRIQPVSVSPHLFFVVIPFLPWSATWDTASDWNRNGWKETCCNWAMRVPRSDPSVAADSVACASCCSLGRGYSSRRFETPLDWAEYESGCWRQIGYQWAEEADHLL